MIILFPEGVKGFYSKVWLIVLGHPNLKFKTFLFFTLSGGGKTAAGEFF